MFEWQHAFKALREKFQTQSSHRLQQMRELTKSLALEQSDHSKKLYELRRHFHWLSGSGGMYGFDAVTQLGGVAEQYCKQLEDIGRATNDEAAELVRYIDDVEKSLQTDSNLHKPHTLDNDSAVEFSPTILLVAEHESADEFAKAMKERGVRVNTATPDQIVAESVTVHEGNPDGALIIAPFSHTTSYQLAQHLRDQYLDEESPLFIIEEEQQLDRVRSILCGADGYFEKPIDAAEVLDKFLYLLERSLPTRYKVLYVEDDPFQSEFISEVLKQANYEVCTCADPDEFESCLLQFQPDLVILDIMLPGVSGFQLAKYIRADEQYATMPIVFVSTQAELENRAKASRYGGDDFLIKPVAPSLLLSVVASKLERTRLLKSLMFRDGLTKLLTHSAFMSQVRNASAKKQRNPEKQLGLVLLDIDRFKSINDTHGHPVGDRVIVGLSSLLRRRLRRSDVVGRYGGEEFIIAVEDLQQPDIVRLAERLLTEFSALEFQGADLAFSATFSAGIAMLEETTNFADWVMKADQALLQAKRAGRNRIICAGS